MKEIEDMNELEGPDGPDGPEDLDQRDEVDQLGPDLSERVDQAVFQCEVQSNNDVNQPLFMLAKKLRGIEEELNVQFSVKVLETVINQWRIENHTRLDKDYDYLTELLDKLSMVRFPEGQALRKALEIAKGTVPPKETARLSPDVQLLASLCRELQRQARFGFFFLDGRSAAKVLHRPHETVASWLRALRRVGVIKLALRGHPGVASRYSYVAND
jgi:hypothetical protein